MSVPLAVTDAALHLPAFRPRLVAIDLDGTCLDADQRLHPRSRDAIRATVAGGTEVVIATGRMYRSALPWARELHIVAPLICYQGAVLRCMPAAHAPQHDGVPQGELIAEDALEASVALEALRTARAKDWHIQAYLDDRLLCEQDRPEAHLYARIAEVPIVFVDDLEPLLAQGSTKMVCVVDDSDGAADCESTLRQALGAGARVVRSLPQFVEITNPLVSKGRALQRVCARLAVDPAEIVAVGDAPNDADMLEMAAWAVAVESAAAEVLALADAVCAPPQRAGVADVLEALQLSRRP